MFLFKAFRSRVTFSLAPKCVEVNCWIQAFLTCEVMAMLGHWGGQILSPLLAGLSLQAREGQGMTWEPPRSWPFGPFGGTICPPPSSRLESAGARG